MNSELKEKNKILRKILIVFIPTQYVFSLVVISLFIGFEVGMYALQFLGTYLFKWLNFFWLVFFSSLNHNFRAYITISFKGYYESSVIIEMFPNSELDYYWFATLSIYLKIIRRFFCLFCFCICIMIRLCFC